MNEKKQTSKPSNSTSYSSMIYTYLQPTKKKKNKKQKKRFWRALTTYNNLLQEPRQKRPLQCHNHTCRSLM